MRNTTIRKIRQHALKDHQTLLKEQPERMKDWPFKRFFRLYKREYNQGGLKAL